MIAADPARGDGERLDERRVGIGVAAGLAAIGSEIGQCDGEARVVVAEARAGLACGQIGYTAGFGEVAALGGRARGEDEALVVGRPGRGGLRGSGRRNTGERGNECEKDPAHQARMFSARARLASIFDRRPLSK
jgi:hypothetical protein